MDSFTAVCHWSSDPSAPVPGPSSMSEKSGIRITPLPSGRERRRARRPRRSPRRRTRRHRRYARPGRPARNTRWRTGRAQRRGHGLRLLGVQRVAGTQARHRGPTGREGLGGRRRVHRHRVVHGLDPARLEQVRGERGPRGVRRRGAERREEDPGPGAGRRQMGVRPGAQRLERLVATDRGQSADARSAPGAGSRSTGRLRELRELADAGDRLRAPRQILAARRPGGRQPLADQAGARAPRPDRRPARSPGRTPRRRRRVRSVSRSTYQEPPAGSITRARCDSSSRIVDVLRAIRRANASGSPSAWSNGSTVTESAPPTPARQTGHRRAQHVHPRIAPRHHHRRRHRVLALRAGGRRPRTPRRPAPTAGARRAAWRWSGTGRRWPRTGTPAGRRPLRRRAPPRSAPADRRRRSPANCPAPGRPSRRPRGTAARPRSTPAARDTPARTARPSARRPPASGALPRAGRAGPAGRRRDCRGPTPGPRPAPRTAAATPRAAASSSLPASSTTGARSR